MTCRGCGCNERHACLTGAGPCYWVEPDLCSACAGPGVRRGVGHRVIALSYLRHAALWRVRPAVYRVGFEYVNWAREHRLRSEAEGFRLP